MPWGNHRVSVVIPTWNRLSVLQQALRSVEGQTYLPDEVIVVDDGSTDGTSTKVPGEFPQVRLLVLPENRGVSSARNAGIQAARSEWIAFLDSDDEWRPTKLERQLEAIRAQPAFRFVHCDEVWIRDGRRVNPGARHRKAGGWIFKQCLPLCAISPSAALLHRSLFKDYGLFDETLPVCEDYDLWLRVCAREPVLFVDELLVIKHGGHADQLSRSRWGMDRYRVQSLTKLLRSDSLRTQDRVAAIKTLHQKIRVYLGGARKRGKFQEVGEYERLLAEFGLAALSKLTS